MLRRVGVFLHRSYSLLAAFGLKEPCKVKVELQELMSSFQRLQLVSPSNKGSIAAGGFTGWEGGREGRGGAMWVESHFTHTHTHRHTSGGSFDGRLTAEVGEDSLAVAS